MSSATSAQFVYTVPCDYDTVCSGKKDTNLVGYSVDKTSIYYISNWVEHFNLYCTEKSDIGLIGSLAFFGAALSCLILPRLGDKYGRYLVWRVTIFLQLPLYFMANLGTHIGVLYVMAFFMGMALLGRFTCGFVFVVESMPADKQSIMGTAASFGDSIITLYIVLFLRYVSNEVSILLWIGLGLNVLALVLSFWLVESPAWLASVDRKDEALKALGYMARFNGEGERFKVTSLKDEKFETLSPEEEKRMREG